jgi:hypothetical protein
MKERRVLFPLAMVALLVATTVGMVEASAAGYFFADPYINALNISFHNEGPSVRYYFLDVPPNAFDLALTLTVMQQPNPGSTVRAFLRRNAPMLTGSGDLEACNYTQTTAPALTQYLCYGMSLSSSPTTFTVKQTRIAQPRWGRYFLTVKATAGQPQLAVSLTFQTCDATLEQAPDETGTCVTTIPMHEEEVATYVPPFNIQYLYLAPKRQALASSRSLSNMIALELTLSLPSCDQNRIYVREGGMPDMDGQSQDITVPCATEALSYWWLYPPSAEVYFLGATGEKQGLQLQVGMTPVFSATACSGSTSGVSCKQPLVGGVLCPTDQVDKCQSSYSLLAQTASQSTPLHLPAADGWSFVAVTVADHLFSLSVAVYDSDKSSTLIDGEQWTLVAHFDTAPNVLQQNLSSAYPYFATATLSLPWDAQNAVLSLDIPYPAAGVWHLALERKFPTPPFGQAPPTKHSTTATLAINQYTCPSGCSGHGRCDTQTHICTCANSYEELDCSFHNTTHAPRTGGDGLVLGLGFSIPILIIFAIATAAFVWWRESTTQRVEMI